MTFPKHLALLTILIVGVNTFSSCAQQSPDVETKKSINSVLRFLVINPSANATVSREALNDLRSLKNSLTTAGIRYDSITPSALTHEFLSKYNVVVVPFATSIELKEEAITNLKTVLSTGVNLVLDGVSSLSQALGLKESEKKIVVSKAMNLQQPKVELYWNDTSEIYVIDTLRSRYNVLCADAQTKQPIVISGHIGTGKFIFFSSLFDQVTDQGYTKFPFLIEYMNQQFGQVTLAERYGAEMFFDPGMRDTSFTPEVLAKLWRARGIKRVYAAGWYFDYGYEYERLIEACHANGILVYCWLEPPMISINFWKQHPEWREKTAFLKDAQIDWRSLVNLADDHCRKAVFDVVGTLLLNNDWDGVNLAELYFEPSPVGPENPANFTPMNDIVRNEFKKSGGFDPIQLFDTLSPHYWKTNRADWKKFAHYRRELCYRLKTNFLDFLKTVEAKKSEFEVMLTVIDVSMTPDLADNIAEDTEHTLALYKKYGFTMQIEDPSSCWGLTPNRYDHLGKLYRKSIKEQDKLIFDCNVVASHELGFGGFPAEKPTGEEIRQITYNMMLSNSRPAFYAEDALNENDFKNISSVLARNAQVSELSPLHWQVQTPSMIRVNTGSSWSVLLDQKPWNAGENGLVIIPPGKHTLTFDSVKLQEIKYHLKTISSELLSAEFGKNNLTFSYFDPINACFIVLDKKPAGLEIDGKKVTLAMKETSGEFSLKLPMGKHNVSISF